MSLKYVTSNMYNNKFRFQTKNKIYCYYYYWRPVHAKSQ